jgi:predicted transcriptional regulator of viral defense system
MDNKYNNLFKENSVITYKQLSSQGVDSRRIQKLLEEGVFYRVKRGIYEIPEHSHSEPVIISSLIPEGIFCLKSALYFHGYTDRTPQVYEISIDRDANKKKVLSLNYPVKPVYFSRKILDIGKTTKIFDSGNITLYDKERTICDIVRYRNKIDQEILAKALRVYANDPEKNIKKLLEYADKLRIEKKIREYMGILL